MSALSFPLRTLAAATAATAAGYGLLAVSPAAPAPRTLTTTPAASTATSLAAATAPSVEHPPSPAGTVGVPTALTPLVADYDGDHRSDVLWYGPGNLPDHLWLGRTPAVFRGSPITVARSYQPVVGDFDGDGRSDVLWYGPGAGHDVLWTGRTSGTFASHAVDVGGTYTPIPGDFNGDKHTDILWYAPGAARDVVWYGRTGGSFASRTVAVGRTFRPVVGDFDGDHRDDVLWYGPGTAGDTLWYGTPGGFTGRTLTVTGTYEPLVGDYDGDHVKDVLWYGDGTRRDVVWYGRTARGFTARDVTMSRTGTPVHRDFDRDGRTDVLVYGAGDAADTVYYGLGTRGFAAKATTAGGTYTPVDGDFDGDGRGDVFWYAAGTPRDVLWYGYGRAFYGRATTLDIGFTRALPLRMETMRDAYNPYGFMAHAMGGLDGRQYTNTLEAFESNYARGFRVFECDQVVLADGTVLVQHDGTESYLNLTKKYADTTWAEIDGRKYAGKYTILRAQDLVALMGKYPDAYFVLDLKYDRVRAFATYVRLTGGKASLMERLIPHVATKADLDAMRTHYPLQNYIVALYQTQAYSRLDNGELYDWVRRDRVPSVMMWWKLRDRSLTLSQNNHEHRRYEPGLVSTLKRFGATPWVHSVDDVPATQGFWDARVGVYTNYLFPPLPDQTTQSAEPEQPAPAYMADEA